MPSPPFKRATVTGTISAINDAGSGTCTASFSIAANNHQMTLSSDAISETGGWVGGGSTRFTHQFLVGVGAASLQIYVQPTSGSFTSSPGVNTWLSWAGTTRTWTKASGATTSTVSFRIRFRDSVTLREFTSMNVAVTMQATAGIETDTK